MGFNFIFDIQMLWLGVLQFFGYFVEGCAGFGGSVIGAPINATLLGADVSVPYATLLALPTLYYTAFKNRQYISFPDLGRIFIALVPGFIIGNYLGMILDPDIAKIGIGGSVTVIALINCYRHIVKPVILKIPVEENPVETKGGKIFRFSCLIIGSMVHGAFTIGGPLITVYTLNAVKDKLRFRNTMLAMWVVLDSIIAGRHAVTGMWSDFVLSAVLISLPFTFLAYYFGGKMLHKINQQQFLRFVYVVLLAVGGNMFIQSVIAVI